MSDFVEISKGLIAAASRMSALEARTKDVADNQARILDKLEQFIIKLSELEANYKHVSDNVEKECRFLRETVRRDCEGLRASVKSEIMTDIKVEIALIQREINNHSLLFQKPTPVSSLSITPSGD